MHSKNHPEINRDWRPYQKLVDNFLTSYQELIKSNNLPSALLVTANDNSLMNCFVHKLLATQYCEKSSSCGECQSCLEYISHGSNDILVIETNEKTMKLGDIEPVFNHLNVRSQANRLRTIIIENFDKANLSTQNALLKYIEEPPENSLIIATSTEPNKLIKTLHSRFIKIRMPVPKLQFSLDWINNNIENEYSLKLTEKHKTNIKILLDFYQKSPVKVWHCLLDIFEGKFEETLLDNYLIKNTKHFFTGEENLNQILDLAEELSKNKALSIAEFSQKCELSLNVIYHKALLSKSSIKNLAFISPRSIRKRRDTLSLLRRNSNNFNLRLAIENTLSTHID